MAAITIPLYYDLDLLRWTKTAGGTAEQPTLVIGQRSEVAFAVRFVRSGAVIELTSPSWIFGIKALNDESGSYLVQTTTGVKTGTGTTTVYTFTVTLDSTELRAYLSALTSPSDNFCVMEIYDSVNLITTLPGVSVVPVESYNVSGTTPTAASGTLIVASGKTATISNTVTLIGTDGTTYDLDAAVGTGDVDGPASATDGVPALFDGTTGKLLKNSTPTGTGDVVRGTSPNITTPTGIVKGDVGLGNVDNTTDLNKPISTATQTALDAKVTGPASATDNAIARFDGTTGKLLENSAATINDDGAIETNGAYASISTNGVGASISTIGDEASISTSGESAVISTNGTYAHIQTRSTFNLSNGTYVTRIDHAPTAERTATLPDKTGTLAMTSDLVVKELEKILYPLIPAAPLDHFDDANLSADWTLKGMVAGDFSKSSASWAKFDLGTATGAAVQRTIHRAWAATTNATLTMRCQYNSLGHGIPMIGPCFTNDVGTGIAFAGYNSGGTPVLGITLVDWYYSSTPLTVVLTQDFSTEQRPYWMRLRKADTTYYFSYSLCGRVWTPESSGIVNATAMTRIGAGMFFRGAGTIYGSSFEIDYFDIT